MGGFSSKLPTDLFGAVLLGKLGSENVDIDYNLFPSQIKPSAWVAPSKNVTAWKLRKLHS